MTRMSPRGGVAALLLAALAAALVSVPAASAKTTWLCRPGLDNDPCSPRLKTTRLAPTGEVLGTSSVRRARPRRIDCFYVYPTVSNQSRPAATRARDPEIRSIALYQAARFSRDCRVFAPVYRQITIQGLLDPGSVTERMRERAYEDVRDAWRTYLTRYSKGRGVVLLGHSQGSFVLRRLIPREVERRRSVRRRLVSAILLGGNVLVREGSDRGGDFERLRACSAPTQLRCVVAYSTYGEPAPENALFGRPTGRGGGLGPAPSDSEVLCTNPASLNGGSGRVTPIYPSEPYAPGTVIGGLVSNQGLLLPEGAATWISVPGAYSARCSSAGGANVLQVTPRAGAPALQAQPDASWGLHLADLNIALGNLTDLVRTQARAYRRRR